MKAIGRLKITQLSKVELGKRELNRLVGGERCCLCGCHYEEMEVLLHRTIKVLITQVVQVGSILLVVELLAMQQVPLHNI